MLFTVLLAPLTGIAGTASAAEATKLTIAGQPEVGVYHDNIGPSTTPDDVRHRGRLTTAGGAPIANAPVHLWRFLAGGDWQLEASDTTDGDGRYQFKSPIEGNSGYAVVYDGDGANYESTESEVVLLGAMRDFNAEVVKKRRVAVFKGNINPGWDNKTVEWQRKTCKTCGWKTITQKKSGDNGSWSFQGNYPPLNKKWFYRATLAGTDQFVKSYSAMLITTRTRPARQPAARVIVR